MKCKNPIYSRLLYSRSPLPEQHPLNVENDGRKAAMKAVSKRVFLSSLIVLDPMDKTIKSFMLLIKPRNFLVRKRKLLDQITSNYLFETLTRSKIRLNTCKVP